jgi:hypothetical protein
LVGQRQMKISLPCPGNNNKARFEMTGKSWTDRRGSDAVRSPSA